MTDDDKTPVDTTCGANPCPGHVFSLPIPRGPNDKPVFQGGIRYCPAPSCGAPIRARDGSVTSYVCNLPRGHLGRHAEVLQDATVTGIAEASCLRRR